MARAFDPFPDLDKVADDGGLVSLRWSKWLNKLLARLETLWADPVHDTIEVGSYTGTALLPYAQFTTGMPLLKVTQGGDPFSRSTRLNANDSISIAGEGGVELVGAQAMTFYFVGAPTSVGDGYIQITSDGAGAPMLFVSPRINLAGGRITFPATPIPSSDANTLDEYEEGTWTPTVTIGGSASGITGSFDGTYVKIGQFVFWSARLVFTSKGASVGQLILSGLPHGDNTGVAWPVYVSYCNNMFGLNSMPVGFHNAGNINIFQLNDPAGNGTAVTGLVDANLTNTSDLVINGWYRAAA